MTPDEIKKALGRCSADYCCDCPLIEKNDCFETLFSEAITYIDELEKENKAMHKLLKERRNTKNEAIKEFAEKLKGKVLTKYDYTDCIDVDDIDNLVKEMVGVEKNGGECDYDKKNNF